MTTRKTYDNIDTKTAEYAIKEYNKGYYRRSVRNVDLDKITNDLFSSFFKKKNEIGIFDLLLHVAKEYGGMERCSNVDREDVCLEISDRIDNSDFNIGGLYYIEFIRSIDTLDELIKKSGENTRHIWRIIRPFLNTNKKVHGKKCNWSTLASKFLHFMNPNVFPIMDSRSKRFYRITKYDGNHVRQYFECIKVVNDILSDKEPKIDMPYLRTIDGPHYQGDIKMIDKIAYILGG